MPNETTDRTIVEIDGQEYVQNTTRNYTTKKQLREEIERFTFLINKERTEYEGKVNGLKAKRAALQALLAQMRADPPA